MKTGTVYNKATGEVIMTVVAPDENGVLLQIRDESSEAVLFDQLVEGSTHYIVNGEVVDRPSMPLSVASDQQLEVDQVLTIEGIPPGSEVIHPDGATIVNDGFVEWASVEPGRYSFRIINFPYVEVSFDAIVG